MVRTYQKCVHINVIIVPDRAMMMMFVMRKLTRYYDPVTFRMLSQDSYRGEKTDPKTWNLYAYCANNPINYTDPTGHKILYNINRQVGVTDDIKQYNIKQSSFNCYSYAIGEFKRISHPGGITYRTSVDTLANAVIKDMKKRGRKCQDVTQKGGCHYRLPNGHWWLVAVRVGSYYNAYDYHFMKKSNNGPWKFKAGYSGPIMQLMNGLTPSNARWDKYSYNSVKKRYEVNWEGFYNSRAKYLAISG